MFLQAGQYDELFGILGVAKPTAYDYSQEEIADLDDFGRIIAKALS
ncbi:MAG: hypothetical protein L3J39_16950 [Verrucomicrobiales bacterium]|nr:hypothetical protein [Verrucomicrobiales bacterium]